MADSTGRWKNWYWCGLDLDLRTRTSITLIIELVASITGIIGFLLSEESGGKIYHKSVRDIIGLILTSFTELSVFVCISAGLYGLNKKKPSLLAPYLICKSYYFIGIFVGIILSWPFLIWYMQNVTGFLTVLIPGALLLLLKIHSTIVVYKCYREMGEDFRRQSTLQGPHLEDSNLQYNTLLE